MTIFVRRIEALTMLVARQWYGSPRLKIWARKNKKAAAAQLESACCCQHPDKSHANDKTLTLRKLSYKFNKHFVGHFTRWLSGQFDGTIYCIESNPFAGMRWNAVLHRSLRVRLWNMNQRRHLCPRVRIIRFLILPETDAETTQDDRGACVLVCLYLFLWPTFPLLSLPLCLECYNRPWFHSREASGERSWNKYVTTWSTVDYGSLHSHNQL